MVTMSIQECTVVGLEMVARYKKLFHNHLSRVDLVEGRKITLELIFDEACKSFGEILTIISEGQKTIKYIHKKRECQLPITIDRSMLEGNMAN